MSLTELIERISSKLNERRETHLAGYRDLVEQVVDGGEPDADKLAGVLRDTERTLEQFREDVELLERRRKLYRQYERLPALEAEYEEIQKKIAAADDQVKKAHAQHDQQVVPLFAQMSTVKQAMRAGQAADMELQQTCTDKALIAELQEVVEQHRHASRQAYELRTEIGHRRALAAANERELQQDNFPSRVRELIEERDYSIEKADRLEQELAGLEKRMAELQKQEKAIREPMLVP